MKFKINNTGKNKELHINYKNWDKKIILTKNLFYLIIILLLLILLPLALWIGSIIMNIVLTIIGLIAIIGILLFIFKPELFKK